jgi:predicted MFS family arabinose efflux permease
MYMEEFMKKGRRNIALVILSVMAGIMFLAPLIRFSFYDQMMAALRLTDIQIGALGSIYGVAYVIAFPFSGILAEKFNARILVVLSAVGMSLVTVWYSMFPGFAVLCAIHVLYGIFSVGTFWSPYLKAIRNLGSENEQGRLFGMSEGIRGIGQAVVAFACLGAMALVATMAAGFRAALLINAGVFALLAIAAFFFLPKTDSGEARTGEGGHNKKDGVFSIAMAALKSSSTWICIFVILCGYTIWTTANSYMGTYGTRVLGLSNELSSTLSIIRSYIIVFVAGFSGGFVMDKFSSKGKGLLLAFGAAGVCAAGIFLSSNFVILCVAITLLLAYMANVIKSTYWSIMGEAGVPLAATGMATGVISLIGLTPDIFTGPIIGRFLHYGETRGDIKTGFNFMLLWLGVWAVLGIIAALILKKRAATTKLAE